MTLGPVDVLVLAALKEELDALLQVRASVHEPWTVVEGDPPLHIAVLDGRAGPIRVAAARLTKVGGIATAALATRLLEAVQPRCLAMCGVCAGHPEDTELGDVVIAERLFQHDEGKIRGDGLQGDLWVDALRADWLRVAQDMTGPATGFDLHAEPGAEDWKWWFLDRLATGRDPLKSAGFRRHIPDERRAEYLGRLRNDRLVTLKGSVFALTTTGKAQLAEHQVMQGTLVDSHPFHVLVGPMGSGNAVEAGGAIWDRVARGGMRKVLAVEMEAAAISRVAHDVGIRFAVAKGVMDHADSHKTDRFKPFAARASAEVLCRFLRAVVKPAHRTSVPPPLDVGSASHDEAIPPLVMLVNIGDRGETSMTAQKLRAAPGLALKGAIDLEITREIDRADPSEKNGNRVETNRADLVEAIRALTRSNARSIPMLPALRAVTGGQIPMVKRSLVRLVEHRAPGAHSSVTDSVPITDDELFTGSQTLARFVVVGDGGDGKSTLLRWFAERLLEDPVTIPLLLAANDMPGEEAAPRSLTAALCRYLTARLNLTVVSRDLEALIESKRFALVIDGVDEIHDRRRLRDIGQMVHDFARRYRHCRVAMACRPWVNAEQPFDESEFVKIRLRPLDADGIGELILAIAEQAKTRGAAVLRPEEALQFICAHEDLQDLAGSPLLCSLMALIAVRSQKPIYFGRTRIYARSLDLLLYEWPRSSGRTELSALASRELFQRVAAHYHEANLDSISVEALIDVCVGFFGRDATCMPRIEANKWWIWQREEIGLLQEDHLGKVRFFHRNFQDCLVADATLTRFAGDLAGLLGAIEHEFGRGKREMLCFLLTAAQAHEALAERTFEHFLTLCDGLRPGPAEDERRWGLLAFLLQVLCAAPAIGSATFDRAMDSLARASLAHCNNASRDGGNIEWCRQMVGRIGAPGHPLRSELLQWFQSRLLGPELDLRHGALWIRPYEMQLAGYLGQAGGDDLLAAACDLGGVHPFGLWARRNMTWEALRSWAITGPMELTLDRCLEAIACKWDPAMFWMCRALILRMHWYGQVSKDFAVALSDDPRVGIFSDTVIWRNGDHAFSCRTLPSLVPIFAHQYGEMRAEQHFELESNVEPHRRLRDLWVAKNIESMGGGASVKSRDYMERFFSYDYCLVFGPECSVWVPRMPLEPQELRHPSREFSQRLSASIWARLQNQKRVSYELLCGEEIFSKEKLWLESGDEPAEGFGTRPGWAPIVAANTREEVASASYRMLLEQLAEAHSGMLVAGHMDAGDQAGKHLQSLYLTVRAQNLWLLHFLDAVATTIGDVQDRPLVQTMLIILVLAQYQTTWRLPEADWWSNIMERQPRQLLPRAFWYLARAVRGGGSGEDIRFAIACLTDANLPDMARLLCVPAFVPLSEDEDDGEGRSGDENVAG